MDQRILWFLDSAVLDKPPAVADDMRRETRELIARAGHPGFTHETVDPFACIEQLAPQLQREEFSTVIDLTGSLGDKLQLRGDVPVLTGFRISRLRKVSSARLDGCGHLFSLTEAERGQLQETFDLSRPLILDDVGWSGRTIVETATALNLPLRHTTAAFLTVNVGTFGEGKPGAAGLLTGLGMKVVAGTEVRTPADDGFHLYRLYA